MNILIIAPNTAKIPPYMGYGGTERVIYDFSVQAARKGHIVDVICKKGSTINGKNINVIHYPPEGGNEKEDLTFLCSHLLHNKKRYDLVNLHIFETEYVKKLSELFTPLVTSIHFYINGERISPFKEMNSHYLVQSKSQERFYRKYLSDKVTGILQGIRVDHIPFSSKTFRNTEEKDLNLNFQLQLKEAGVTDYLLILSKISRRKGQLTAIKLSKDLGIPLVIAGEPKNDYEGARETSVDYFNQQIKPLIDNKNIFYFGNANETEKYELMKYAQAFILPTGFEDDWWREAFGRVVAESLATGTPVVAHKNGAMEEQIIDGKNGYLFTTYDEAIEKLKRIGNLSRRFCRKDARKILSSERFTTDCLAWFGEILRDIRRERSLLHSIKSESA